MKDKIMIPPPSSNKERIPSPISRECFLNFIGSTLVGTIFLTDRDNLTRNGPGKVLVFDNGQGLLITDNGFYRVVGMSEMGGILVRTKKEYEITLDNRKLIDKIFDLSTYENRIPNDPLALVSDPGF